MNNNNNKKSSPPARKMGKRKGGGGRRGRKPLTMTVRRGNRSITGRGSYQIPGGASVPSEPRGLLARLAEPFTNNTASVGLVNKGARWLGNRAGAWTGIPGASNALGNAASYAARFLGFGDYSVQKNCLANEAIATFKGSEDTTISGREFIANINGSNLFSLTSFIINPGNAALFPWLSTVARNYEEWSPMGIVFEYRTTSAFATGTTNSALGTIVMATDYDVVDVPYATKQSMLISTFSNSQAPCTSFYHPVECASSKNPLNTYYVQNGTTAADYPDDPRFSALGNFQIAAEGMQVTNVVGELWVSYRFKFSKPQLELESTRNYSHTRFSGTITGSAVVVKNESINPSLIVSGVCTGVEYVNIKSLPAGDYMFSYSNNGPAITNTQAGTSANVIGTANGAEVLQHTASKTGTYGTQDSDMAAMVANTANGRQQWSAAGWVIFRMTGPTSELAVPLYTFNQSGAAIVTFRDFYISRIPVYSETLSSSNDFMRRLLENRKEVMALLMSGKDEVQDTAVQSIVIGQETESDGEELQPATYHPYLRREETTHCSSSSSSSKKKG